MSTMTSRRPISDIAAAPLQRGDTLHVDAVNHRREESAPEPTLTRMSRIARRAHEIYEARGGQHGKATEDWLMAERQIDDEIDRVRSVDNRSIRAR